MGEIKSRFDSSTMRFDTYLIQIFNDSIEETRDLNRNLEVMVEIEYSFSLLTTQSDLIFKCLVLPSLVVVYARNNSLFVIIRGRLWTARSMHVKALLRKWKFQWLPLAGTNKIEIKPFCCFGIWNLIWDLPITALHHSFNQRKKLSRRRETARRSTLVLFGIPLYRKKAPCHVANVCTVFMWLVIKLSPCLPCEPGMSLWVGDGRPR